MDIAKRLQWLPGLLALALALATVTLRRMLTRPSRRGPPAIAAMQAFFSEAAYLAVMHSFLLDSPPIREIGRMLEPLRPLGRRIPAGAWLLVQAVVGITFGQLGRVKELTDEMLSILASDHISPVAKSDRENAEGAAHYMRAMSAVLQQDSRCMEEVAKMEALGLRYFAVSADICKLIYRRIRGEEEEALAIESTIELQLVQAGSMWGPESQITWMSSLAYGLTRDVLGLRRSIAELTRLVEQGFHVVPHLELARGEYLRERGDLPSSRGSLERALEALDDAEESQIRIIALAALAETHLAAGDIRLATDRATEALALGSRPDVLQTTWCARATRVLALARATAGDPDAANLLDRAIDGAKGTGSPLLCGSLHEARARIALAAGDIALYSLHRQATGSWFRATRNPALVARAERLRDVSLPAAGSVPSDGASDTIAGPAARTVQQAMLTHQAVTISEAHDGVSWASAVLSGCRGPDERAARALELLLDACAGSAGFLYLLRGGRFQIVAPSYGDEPPESLVQELIGAPPDGTSVVERVDLRWRPDTTKGDLLWHRVWLTAHDLTGHGGKTVGAALVMGDSASHVPPSAIVDRIARELFDAGDASVSDGRVSG